MITVIPPPTDVVAAIDAACERIAPTWPLDRFIAVNPYWGWRGIAVAEAAARLGVLAGTALTMPRSWFRGEWAAGRLDERHLEAAAAAAGDPELALAAHAVLHSPDQPEQPTLARLPLVSDLRDRGRGPLPGRTWTDLVVHQISQHCAAYADRWQASWAPDSQGDLFRSWRVDPAVTHGFSWQHGRRWARAQLDSLPDTSTAVIATVLDDLGLDPNAHEAYLTAALASINGWAAWCAYRRWQARLDGGDDATIVDLLAVRLAWEWLLARDMTQADEDHEESVRRWADSWIDVEGRVAETVADQRIDWVLQDAVERTEQERMSRGLRLATPDQDANGAPEVQAVFCIDVRSEVFRRALEAATTAVHTRGFAGFFGLPIAYTPAGSALTRPQLPGLLAPSLTVSETEPDPDDHADLDQRQAVLAGRRRWLGFRRGPSSMFSFVESMGLVSAVKLVKDSVPHEHAPSRWEDDGLDPRHRGRRPRLALVDTDPASAASIAHRVLTTMGLPEDFAPIVLLCGHGSHSANNPHAAGLDCGACGGQTGEVNARVLADLLNAGAVRDELRALGIDIPPGTWFLAGLHDTTTDAVELFDTEGTPPSLRPVVDRLTSWLHEAGDRARAERADRLGLGSLATRPRLLEQRLAQRADDWSQVRPEWGLAGNAAFVVAPRHRTRHLDLQGRCFLHEYDWHQDTELSVLTQILTAPMVVTNWINLQYHASTVDNRRYGSGNKVLHNVVGGTIGVFEGNGGDLRIGLPMQSLHDGHELRHRPVRLSVYVEAARAAIDSVVTGNQVVRDLVVNGWLHLLRIDPPTGLVERHTPTGWEPVS